MMRGDRRFVRAVDAMSEKGEEIEYADCRAKPIILDAYDRMQPMIGNSMAYQTAFEPPCALSLEVASAPASHANRMRDRIQGPTDGNG